MRYVLATLLLVASSNVFALGSNGASNTPKPQDPNKVKSTEEFTRRLESLNAEVTNQNTQLDKDIVAADAKRSEIEAAITAAEAELTAAKKRYNDTGKWWLLGYGRSTSFEDRVKTAQAKLDSAKALRSQIDEHETAARATAGRVDQLNKDLERTNAAMEQQIQGMRTQLRSNSVLMKYSDLERYFDNHDDRLSQIEEEYDKTVLAAYVQDKIAQLVNSQTICSAVKRCNVADPKKIPDEQIRNELFPGSTAIRKDSYDHVNKRNQTK